MDNQSPIVDFYKKQTIFLTGASGYIGKVLIGKLLKLCPDVKIYILLRPKRNKTSTERLNDIFSFACFEPLRQRNPDFYKNVQLVSGDCAVPGLGLSSQDREILKREVTVVVHAAANVKFDQVIKVATYTNVRAARDMLNLAKEMVQLKAFLYVSTVYSNCPQSHIKEEFYDPPMTADSLLKLVDSVDEDVLNAITPSLLKNWPNTYVFTKCIAEDVVRKEAGDLPLAIVRPSIIISSFAEPLVGWIDNFYGPVGVCAGMLLGVFRNLYGNPDYPLHMVPCDFVVNLITVATWDIANRKSVLSKEERKIPIYNYVFSAHNVQNLGKLEENINITKWDYPVSRMVWFPTFKVVSCLQWYKIRIFFQQTLLAHFADFVLTCLGRQKMAVAKMQQVHKMTMLLSYFVLHKWDFDNDNVRNMWRNLSENDQKLFMFDVDKKFDWKKYWVQSIKYGRVFLLNDQLETIPRSRTKIKIFAVLYYVFIAFLLYICFRIFQIVFRFVL